MASPLRKLAMMTAPMVISDATNTPGRLRGQIPRAPAEQARTSFSEQQRQFDTAMTPESKTASELRQKVALLAQMQQALADKKRRDAAKLRKNPAALLKKTAGRKLHGRMKFRDLEISIENRVGSVRHWYDPHAKREGKTEMKYPYGYIRRTEGLDGDHVDVFVGHNEQAKYVYVITTNKAPDFKAIDEQKCMLGFDTAEDAKAAFHEHYTDNRFFRSMKALPYAEFQKKVHATFDGPVKKVAAVSSDGMFGAFWGSPSSRASEKKAWDTDSTQRTIELAHPGSHGQQATFAPNTAIEEKERGLPEVGATRHIIDEPLDRMDRIDRTFRFNDQDQRSTAIEGAWGSPVDGSVGTP